MITDKRKHNCMRFSHHQSQPNVNVIYLYSSFDATRFKVSVDNKGYLVFFCVSMREGHSLAKTKLDSILNQLNQNSNCD